VKTQISQRRKKFYYKLLRILISKYTNLNIRIANCKQLIVIVTNKTSIYNEIEKQILFEECLYRLLNLHRLLSILVKVKIYKNLILPVTSYGRKTKSLALRGDHS